MPVVAVINRKGGSGKSTLATHLAAYCATSGLRAMLGDVDRQQSSLAWLRRRAAQAPVTPATIVGWAVEARTVMRPPAGITHVVLDTPGGLRGFDLARVVMNADAILMPVCSSAFDRESALECYAELMALPRVASGRCKVALVGMRLDARTGAAAQLEAWAAHNKLPYLGALRETQAYVRSAEQGLTLFDLPPARFQADLTQWQPVVDWVQAAWRAAERAVATEKALDKTGDRAGDQFAERGAERAAERASDKAAETRAARLATCPADNAVPAAPAPALGAAAAAAAADRAGDGDGAVATRAAVPARTAAPAAGAVPPRQAGGRAEPRDAIEALDRVLHPTLADRFGRWLTVLRPAPRRGALLAVAKTPGSSSGSGAH